MAHPDLDKALRAAVAVSAHSSDTLAVSDRSDRSSDEDYDDLAAAGLQEMELRRRRTETQEGDAGGAGKTQPAHLRNHHSLSATVIFQETTKAAGDTAAAAAAAVTAAETRMAATPKKDGRSFVVSIDDPRLAEMLREDLLQVREEMAAADEEDKDQAKRRRRGRRHGNQFRDFVFTSKFSAFDRQNADAFNSPFHGFFTLFWLSVFLFIVKIAANNWRETGSPLGTHEIMSYMFRRDVVVLLASDAALCALTGVSWLLQRAVLAGRLDWDRSGWVWQNVWQLLYFGGFVGWTQLRDWPWSHTVYFVLHGLVMLMKQHSYAFYNGYLSTMYKRRATLQKQLQHLDALDVGRLDEKLDIESRKEARGFADKQALIDTPPHTPSTPEAVEKVMAALRDGRPLDADEVPVFARVLCWEIGVLSEELRGKASEPANVYPSNLTAANFYEYIPLPTVVYELEYPRSAAVNWCYAAEKLVACFGLLFVMISISQATIYPIVVRAAAMKDLGIPLADRFREFPLMMADLIFPFMIEYLLAWYLIWETILNFLAEICRFADRSFYADWWNSTTWDGFARDWNRPVHLFLLRHVYHSSISALKVKKHTATLITFFLSACVHELVMCCIFKKLRGYLLFLQMLQLPLIRMSNTKFMRDRPLLSNIIFWFGLFMGPSMLCSLYLIL